MKFKALSLLFPLKSAIEDAQAFVDDVSYRHDIPHGKNVPADLADKEGTWQLNSNGYPVAGQVLMDDIGVGFSSPALPLYIGLYALVAVLMGLLPQLGLGIAAPALLLAYFIGFFCYFGFLSTVLFAALTVGASALLPFAGGAFAMVGMKTSFIQDIFNLIPAFAPLVYLIYKTNNRASELAYQGTMNARAIIRAPKALKNDVRHIQALKAQADKSHIVHFGNATGSLSFNGDSYAPDNGLPVSISLNDLSSHMMVFGSTGGGKTTIFRNFIKEINFLPTATISKGVRNGIFLMDGKGEFALDCAKYLDAIIQPGMKNLNILDGSTPETFANMLKDLSSPSKHDSGNSRFFTDSARNIVFIAGVFHEAACEKGYVKYNLSTLREFTRLISEKASDGAEHALIPMIREHEDFAVESTLLNDAVKTFMQIQSSEGDTLKNILSTVDSWFAPFFQNKVLRPWCDSTTSDIEVTDVLWGKSIGLCLPEATFPTAGPMISKFLKSKVFKAIQKRGNGWRKQGMSPVFFIADEVQILMDNSDQAILPIARSLGLSCIFATQNADSFFARFPKDEALALLDSFRSIISFKSSDQTYAYLQARVGKDRVWVEQIQTGMISYGLSNKLNMASPMFDPNNQYRGWMKHFSMGAIKKFFKRSTVGSLQGDGKAGLGERYATMQLSEQPVHILQDKDIQIVQTTKFTAIAVLERAGAPRRDIINVIPLDENFEIIPTSLEELTVALATEKGGAK